MTLCALDFETTGLTPGTHGLVSIGASCWLDRARGVTWNFRGLVLPHENCAIEPRAIEINGYNREKWIAQGAVPINEALAWLVRWLDAVRGKITREGPLADLTPLAHNAAFERKWLEWTEEKAGMPIGFNHRWACSQTAFQFLMDAGNLPAGSSSLDRLGALAGLWPAAGRGPVHDAADDAAAALKAYHWLMSRIPHETPNVVLMNPPFSIPMAHEPLR